MTHVVSVNYSRMVVYLPHRLAGSIPLSPSSSIGSLISRMDILMPASAAYTASTVSSRRIVKSWSRPTAQDEADDDEVDGEQNRATMATATIARRGLGAFSDITSKSWTITPLGFSRLGSTPSTSSAEPLDRASPVLPARVAWDLQRREYGGPGEADSNAREPRAGVLDRFGEDHRAAFGSRRRDSPSASSLHASSCLPWAWATARSATTIRRDQQSALFGVRGKGSTSRMFAMPVAYCTVRSKPRPKPAWGTVP